MYRCKDSPVSLLDVQKRPFRCVGSAAANRLDPTLAIQARVGSHGAEGDAVRVLRARTHGWYRESRIPESTEPWQERNLASRARHFDRIDLAENSGDERLAADHTAGRFERFDPYCESALAVTLIAPVADRPVVRVFASVGEREDRTV